MNKNGFTLIELIAVILIIAIILLLVVPNMGNIKDNVKNKLWLQNEERLVEAAKKYMYAKDITYPDSSGESIIVTKDELLSEKYINQIYDLSDKEKICSGYVLITNISNKYKYNPYIYCENSYISKTVVSDGLLAYWKLHGNALDSSGNEKNGVINGATATPNRLGEDGHALNFNGTSNYVNLNGFTNAGTTHTISMWIYSTDTGATVNKFFFDSSAGRLLLGWGSGTASMIGFYDTAWHNSGTTPSGSWKNIVFLFNGTTNLGTMYLDGEKYGNDLPYIPRQIGGSVSLGSRFDMTSYFFPGKISDLRIYNRVLSPEEIKHNYDIEKYTSI